MGVYLGSDNLVGDGGGGGGEMECLGGVYVSTSNFCFSAPEGTKWFIQVYNYNGYCRYTGVFPVSFAKNKPNLAICYDAGVGCYIYCSSNGCYYVPGMCGKCVLFYS